MEYSLARALKESTAQAHEEAEQSTFMSDLVSGGACLGSWSALAQQLLPVYTAMEQRLDELAASPLVQAVDDPALRRLFALQQDVTQLDGSVPVLPATQEYVRALEVATDAELVGHHYVRYLGDLSGGQIIATMLKRHYGATDEVLNFYRFADIPKPKVFKDAYRDRLDALELSASQRDAILHAAADGFRFNQAVFAQLDGSAGQAHVLAGVKM
ncbi:heme oxygenase (biliverdin-producing) [Corynebacterium tapiri]|uniref:Biliverdin-producing heme oxygenase n=1 Tax=Corynebacterium tapiri TaxID=1448266 RepID=A0A5C4U6W0_9CORY|nr:biliverdin-producing heme oxygenase [Corynebacterium tapiri]TNM00519.1 biliverdin-producing heme oxygenase [Corynebacterium tapiri]